MDLNVTENAIQKMKFYLQDRDLDDWGVRIVAKTKTEFAFSLTEMKHVQPTDSMILREGIKIIIDDISKPSLEGGTVDFVESELGSGFKVEPKVKPVTAPKRDLPDLDLENPVVKKVHDVIQQEINPSIAAHGGFANLLGVEGSQAFIELGGGCQGCASSLMTLKQGIEVRIKEAVPEITEVIDQTDHSAGVNPYF